MEQFKKNIQSKLFVSIGGLLSTIIIISVINYIDRDVIWHSITLFQIVLFAILVILFIFTIVKYIRVLCNITLLEKQYIKESDERSRYISNKSASLSFNIILSTLTVATIISGYFNDYVFFTLLYVLTFVALVGLVSFIYYKRKI